MIEVSRVKVSDLIPLANDPSLAERDNVPISRHRAISHAANPRANPSDVVLYLAYYNGELVGYRTVMPDILYLPQGEVRVGWLSGNWVNPEHRRKGIASALLNEALKDWNHRLMFTNYAPESKAVYDKVGEFKRIYKFEGRRFYLRPCFAYLLPGRNGFSRKLKPLFKAADIMLSLVNPLPLLAYRSRPGEHVELEYMHRPDNDIATMFEKECEGTLTRRKLYDLAWILRFPWLVNAPLGDRIGKRYYFSSAPKRYYQLLLKIYCTGQLVGFLIINVNNRSMSVPYSFVLPFYRKVAARVLLAHAAKLKVNYLTVYQPAMVDALASIKPFSLLSRKHYRKYYATENLANELQNVTIRFEEGDGDCAFI